MSRALDDAITHRADILRILKALDDHALAELERRGRQRPGRDGYPGGGDGVGGGSGVSRPTEGALLSRLRVDPETGRSWWVTPPDPIGQAIGEIFSALAEAAGALSRAGWLRAHLDSQDPELRPTCEACGRTCRTASDRLRAGWCNACRMAWIRAGYPDRAAFARTRAEPTGRTA